MANPSQPAFFSGMGPNNPNFNMFSSVMESLGNTNGGTIQTAAFSAATTNRTPAPAAATSTPISSIISRSAVDQVQDSTTLSTVTSQTSPSPSPSSPPASTSELLADVSSSVTQANAASIATTSSVSTGAACHGLSCSPGLIAAVIVPVVIFVLGLVGILVFCIMRRRRRARSDLEPTEKGFKGGFKNTGYTHEHQKRGLVVKQLSTSTDRSNDGSIIVSPIQSKEVVQRFSNNSDHLFFGAEPRKSWTGQVRTSMEPRITITSPADNRRSMPSIIRDPFSDSAEQSPVERSPFDDPPDFARAVTPPPSNTCQLHRRSRSLTPVGPRRRISHESSLYQHSHASLSADDDTNSDAGTIREVGEARLGRRISVGSRNTFESDHGDIQEARVGRHVSIASGGRTIENVRRDS